MKPTPAPAPSPPPPRSKPVGGAGPSAEQPAAPSALRRWLYEGFFQHMRVDDHWSEAVRRSAARGTVVYVMRAASTLDALCLHYLTLHFDLPSVRFISDLSTPSRLFFPPAVVGSTRSDSGEAAFSQTLAEGQSALLFLRSHRRGGAHRAPPHRQGDLIRALIEAQRRHPEPILVVPQTFVWTKRPRNKRPTVADLLFGSVDNPGKLRVSLRFLLNYRNAQLRSGEPFDVAAFLRARTFRTDAQAADALRYAMLRRIEREHSLVTGPAKKSPTRLREELIRSPRVRRHLEHAARDQKRSVAAVVRDVDRELRHLCARQDPTMLALFERGLKRLFGQIYDGMVVDGEGFERAREAARRGPLIFLPSHRSHIDYLLLSYVVAQHALSPPLIAAGENLSFFPVGAFLRHCGAFFIRRSFGGRRLYTALVDAYLRKVLLEGYNVEFFLEGGRSRTGKLLPPKLGLLSMVVDAGLRLPSRTLSFVPVSICYERVIEEGAYTREQGGGDKEPESVGGMLRSARFLRSRYGRIYITLGEISSLDDFIDRTTDRRDGDDRRALKPAERRAVIQQIAHRMTYEISRATTVTPSALVACAILCHRARGIRYEDLLRRVQTLVPTLDRTGARVAPSLRSLVQDETAERNDVVHRAIALFAEARFLDDRDGIYLVPEGKRIFLEYHKNSILHFFVPFAMVATALPVEPDQSSTEGELRTELRELSALFKYEFPFRTDASFDVVVDQTLTSMKEASEVVQSERGYAAVPGSLVPVYRRMLQPYVEAYRVATSALEDVTPGESMKRNDWLKQALHRGDRMYLSGAVELKESLSIHKLDNALHAFHDLGLVRASGETLKFAPPSGTEDARRALDQRLRRYVG